MTIPLYASGHLVALQRLYFASENKYEEYEVATDKDVGNWQAVVSKNDYNQMND